jgi:RNA polymerase sigma-70 factor (sigma-E family)
VKTKREVVVDQVAETEFRDFVTACSPELMRRAFVLVGGDYEAARDLVQAALAKALSRWDSIDQPIAYVRTIMYRQQINWWRRGWGRMELPSAEVPERAGDDTTYSTELKLTVRAALYRLTPRQRAVLFLRYFEDLSEAEAANILGCSVGNIRSTSHRALARLREIAPELAEFSPSARITSPAQRSPKEALT